MNNGCVVYVENDRSDADLATMELLQQGLHTFLATSLVEGEQLLKTIVSAYEPVVALLDIKTPTSYHNNLESHVLAAVLRRRMQQGSYPPIWLVGITAYRTPQCVTEATFAGFHSVLDKPLTTSHVRWLSDLLQQTPSVSQDALDTAQDLYQLKAQEVFALIQKGSVSTYTSEDIQLLLSTVTSYPTPRTINKARQASLLISLGGTQAVRKRFEQWYHTQPVKSTPAQVLKELLAYRDPRETLKYIHRSTIFRNIQVLPKLIARTFSSIGT